MTIHWDSVFETGLEEVDSQHRVLMDIINRFGEQLGIADGFDWQNVDTVFSEVFDYAAFHFCEEEHMMMAKGIDADYQEQHKQLHHNFMVEVKRMRDELTPDDLDSASQLFYFLMYWLVHHIMGIDQGLAQQVRAIDAGLSPKQALAQAIQGVDRSAGPLLESLHGLVDIISTRNRQLMAMNASLEAKVAERTKALLDANQQLERMALTDALTGLPNRRHALQWLARLWEESTTQGTPLALMMIDADGFKAINDTYGHEAGDVVLIELSRALTQNLRTDDCVCRLGGDEFLVLCPKTPLVDALRVAEKLREHVASLHISAGDGVWQGSISVGVGERGHLTSPEALIKVADDSVYVSKRDGRNCVRTVQ